MKRITLRVLLREPLRVKRLLQSGGAIEVTERGRPLWVIRAAEASDDVDDAGRREAIELELSAVRKETRSGPSLSAIVLAARR